MAKVRVESGQIKSAQLIGTKGNYIVAFDVDETEWNDKPLVLSSSRQPYEARVFKSSDGAIAELKRIGIKSVSIELID
ncbi:hypothetical protein CWE21_11095 [Pseudidiomarina aquimaris]|uniref:Uncharacterized protein n=2 Tax=Pseudidiomarina aquimaris TaxID=641841 RepID=A0A432XCF2_9GAMM|nr:hypothetical protein CWE21_11095 [Pseudidiomarina aquimaris]